MRASLYSHGGVRMSTPPLRAGNAGSSARPPPARCPIDRPPDPSNFSKGRRALLCARTRARMDQGGRMRGTHAGDAWISPNPCRARIDLAPGPTSSPQGGAQGKKKGPKIFGPPDFSPLFSVRKIAPFFCHTPTGRGRLENAATTVPPASPTPAQTPPHLHRMGPRSPDRPRLQLPIPTLSLIAPRALYQTGVSPPTL